MFTTGSKLFIGASFLAVVATIVYGLSTDGGPLGTITLASVAIAFIFLTVINFRVRDSNVSAADVGGIETCAASNATPARSMWPMVAGLGAALLCVGLVAGFAITWMAIIVVFIATVEWMVLSWSDRASGDPAYNASVRRRIMHPMELPILGAVGLGLVIFSFSRIMLYKPGNAAMVIFGGIGSMILLFGALIAAKRTIGRSLVTAVCAIGAVGLLGAGVATALEGGHHIEKHELAQVSEEGDNCRGELTEADEDASRAVGAKSSLAATIILEDGQLRAEVLGFKESPAAVTLIRSNQNFVKFENHDEGEYRLRVYLGDEVIDGGTETERREELALCTQAVGEGGQQFLVLKPPRPSITALEDDPYRFEVPGLDGAELRIVVP